MWPKAECSASQERGRSRGGVGIGAGRPDEVTGVGGEMPEAIIVAAALAPPGSSNTSTK